MRFIISTICLFLFSFVYGTETEIIIRAQARDAKFIGSSLGGAHIRIVNKLTGDILAAGETKGSTGDTRLIMMTTHARGARLSNEETAKFHATIDIEEPTFVTIEVLSPLNHRQSQVFAQTELWLIPGKHILGDGIIIEIPGFIVDILNPRTHQYIDPQNLEGQALSLQANIVMMCGCTINEGGLWDANQMEVEAIIKRNGSIIAHLPLAWVETNLFELEMNELDSGLYEIFVTAYDSTSGNTGVDIVNFIIE